MGGVVGGGRRLRGGVWFGWRRREGGVSGLDGGDRGRGRLARALPERVDQFRHESLAEHLGAHPEQRLVLLPLGRTEREELGLRLSGGWPIAHRDALEAAQRTLQ